MKASFFLPAKYKNSVFKGQLNDKQYNPWATLLGENVTSAEGTADAMTQAETHNNHEKLGFHFPSF